jgi:hypothetical protein
VSTIQTSKVSFPLHLIIHHLQTVYGFQQHNYPQYLTYLTNRLSSLRKSLRVHSSSSSSGAAIAVRPAPPPSPSTAGQEEKTEEKEKEEVEVELPSNQQLDAKSAIRALLVRLLLVERSAAQSSQAHQSYLHLAGTSSVASASSSKTTAATSSATTSASNEPKMNKLSHREKKYYQKAIGLTHELVTACLETCDEQTVLEAKAYLYHLQGALWFHQEDWTQCSENYLKASVIYRELLSLTADASATVGTLALSTGGGGEEELSKALPFLGNVVSRVGRNKAVYQFYLENLEPPLRFCRYNLGTPEPTSSPGADTGSGSLVRLFSDDLEMLNKLETIRLKALTHRDTSGQEEKKSGEGRDQDPIYQFFDTIVWCNRHVRLPVASSTSNASAAVQEQDRLIASLYGSCGKLISFLELQQPAATSKKSTRGAEGASSASASSSSCLIPSLYLPQDGTAAATATSSASSSSAVTHYLSLLQEIVATVTRLINHSSATSPLAAHTQHLTTDSLKYFQQYFAFLQYHTQHQHGALMLKTLQQTAVSDGSHEWKLGNAQEKVHLCDQIMSNIKEMMKRVEGQPISPAPLLLPFPCSPLPCSAPPLPLLCSSSALL